MAPLLLLLFQAAVASTTTPSCLTANITWDFSTDTAFIPYISTPELCQQLCMDSPSCKAVTWHSPEASGIPLYCITFSTTSTELPCSNCVSGPGWCSCSSEGDCQEEGDNIIEQFTDIASEQECAALCLKNKLCQFFTFFGENSARR